MELPVHKISFVFISKDGIEDIFIVSEAVQPNES